MRFRSIKKQKSSKPPRLAEKILLRMRKNGEEFSFLGDMSEEYSSCCHKRGKKAAQVWYWGQVLINFPAFIKDSFYWSCHMLKNYFVITWRNIKRNKGFSFINITGLAVGMSACLLILLWVRDELSFNRFHENGDSIYVAISERVNYRGEFFESTPVPLAEPLKNDFPEIARVVRFHHRNGMTVRYEDKIFNDWEGAFVDPEVFNVFTFPLAKGDAASVFEKKDSIVLTEEAAEKLFAGIDPLGRMMEIEGDLVPVKGALELPGLARWQDVKRSVHV